MKALFFIRSIKRLFNCAHTETVAINIMIIDILTQFKCCVHSIHFNPQNSSEYCFDNSRQGRHLESRECEIDLFHVVKIWRKACLNEHPYIAFRGLFPTDLGLLFCLGIHTKHSASPHVSSVGPISYIHLVMRCTPIPLK